MKKSYFNIGYYISEGFHSIFTHGLMSFAAVFMIVACLLIMGSFSLVAVNLERELGRLEQENEFLAFVDETYTRQQAQALESKLTAVDNVSTVTFIPKEEAKTNFTEKHASDQNATIYSDLPDDVFRDRYAVHMKDISRQAETVAAVEAIQGIDGHRADMEVSEGLVMVRNVATAVALILIALLLLISLFIIYNTIKLGTFTRREEIAIMKMCGATNSFVRGPFIFEGMLLGLFGALVAFFCQWGVYSVIAQAIDTGETFQLLQVVPFAELRTRVLGIFAGTGLVVGTCGSVMAIRKFLQV